MRKINPYKTYKYALASLDNGGGFFNIRSKANDGNISSAELAKAAGIFSSKQNMILHLEMSLIDLENETRNKVLSHLSENLKTEYLNYKPDRLTPMEAKQNAVLSNTAIITGIPELIDSKTEFTGVIMIPIITDKMTSFTMMPIIDQYDVYKLRDQKTEGEFFIAHNRSSRKLSKRLTRCGGIIKELKFKETKESNSNAFLEMVYYSY